MIVKKLLSSDDLQSIQRFNTVITGESLINPFTAITDNVANLFTGVTNTVTAACNRFVNSFTTYEDRLEMEFSPTSTGMLLKKVRYIDISEMTAYKPAGLSGTWKAYLDELCYCADLLVGIDDNLLRPYREFLSKVLSGANSPDGSTKTSISGLNIDIVKYREMREKSLADIAKLFKVKGETNTDRLEAKWKDVVVNNTEWEGVCKLTTKLINTLNKLNRKQLMRDADGTAAMMKALVNVNPHEFSKKIISDISEGGVEYVSFLEFYSVTYYRALTLLGALRMSAVHIKTVLGDK